jgi:hypothetical protein
MSGDCLVIEILKKRKKLKRPTKYKIHFEKRSRKAKDQPKYRYKHEEVEYPGPVTFTSLHHIHTHIL